MILLGVLLTLGTALFVAAEFSLVALDPVQVDKQIEQGDKQAKKVAKTLKELSTQLSGAQVGITITTILLGYTTQTALTELLTEFLENNWLSYTTATAVAVVVAVITVNAFSMVFGELIPKNIALSNPLKVAIWVVPAQRLFTLLFRPVILLLNGLANMVVRACGVEPMETASSARSAREIAAMVQHSVEEGAFDSSTAKLITRSVNFNDLVAADVMTDRGRMEVLNQTDTAQDIITLARETGHSRFPVVGEDSDDILGFVTLRRAVAIPYARRTAVPVTASSLLSEAPKVPETAPLVALLEQLRQCGLQMAIVVDEYGGTAGLVTLEDVIEEIVGEVADEHDLRRKGVRREGSRYILEGDLRPDEIFDRIGVKLPDDGPYETLAGLILYHLARLPKMGERLEIEGIILEIKQMEERRITKVILQTPYLGAAKEGC